MKSNYRLTSKSVEEEKDADEDRINILIDELKRIHQQYGYESAANAIAEYHSCFDDPNTE